MADSLQDLIRSRLFPKQSQEKPVDSTIDLFTEYLKTIDIHLVERSMGFKPAKSVEFGKTDQSMLNHIRNGILFLLRFNKALEKLQARPLDEVGLRNCIALFVVHELHKLEFAEFLDEEDLPERIDSMETAFEIPRKLVRRFIDEMGLRPFAPELSDDDYFSVAVALHKSRFSRSGARTSRFMDLEPFLYLMDNMASCASPEEAVSARSLIALRDGFPQDSADSQLNLQYHRLDDVKGILTGILNKSVADVMESKGLIMLMAYQDGCVYLGRGRKSMMISDESISDIYKILQENIKNPLPNLSGPSSILAKKLSNPRLGFYGLSDEYYLLSDPKDMIRAFIEKSLVSAHELGKGGLTDSTIKYLEEVKIAIPIEFETSEEGRKILIGFARAVATVHKSFVSELIPDDNREALLKTCELWSVSQDICDVLLKAMEKHHNILGGTGGGGKWGYSYAIGQSIMNQEMEGTKLRNATPVDIIDRLVDQIYSGLSKMDRWDGFVSEKTDKYRTEIVQYLHDVLSINGTISHPTLLSDTYDEYKKGGKICNICNRGTTRYLNKSDMKNSNSFLSFNFSNSVFVGAGKPENILTCAPCGVELALRMLGFDKDSVGENETLYFHFIPDYYFTPESWTLANTIFMNFSRNARVQIEALSAKIFSSKYKGKSTELEGDIDIYDSWLKYLASEESSKKDKQSKNVAQYMAQAYDSPIGDAIIVFYKPSNNTTEFHFFGVFIALVIAAYTGMRVVISQSPISSIRGRDFQEFVALDSINSHVVDFYGKFVPLSKLEEKLKLASSLIQLGYNSRSGREDSSFPKYLRIIQDEIFPGSHLLRMIHRASEDMKRDKTVDKLLDMALFLDEYHEEENHMIRTSDRINHLAELGFGIVQPEEQKPYAVERLFRESVKAITDLQGVELSINDYKSVISGRIQKTIERMRSDSTSIPDRENIAARADEYADYFVEKILNEMCEGKISRLKKLSNSFADGYYSSTLRIQRDGMKAQI